MARMIPPVIPNSCQSLGEKEIFSRLKEEASIHDWVVLHSLDIAQHVRQVSGEADFVIIAPSLGVLCLEVKACRSLRRENGLWFYGHNPKGDPRGPFKQGTEAMYSLRQQVIQKDSSLSKVLFCSAVAFPFIEFSAASGEWHSWQIIDTAKFKQKTMEILIKDIFRSAAEHLQAQSPNKWSLGEENLPTVQQVSVITKILRSNFEFAENTTNRRLRKQAELIRYTEEQFTALDMMEDNPRILFTGPAGTGKTFLALEAARRAINSGKSVLLICFNRLLGEWLSQAFPTQDNSQITVGTLHQYLMRLASIKVPESPGEYFWKTELPEAALFKLLEAHCDIERFDVVIADEVQDLLHPPYLDVMELVLRGGLAGGSWRMFGDFERQVLYEQGRDQADELLRTRMGSFARGALRVNCRNTPRIAAISQFLGRLTPSYSRILRPDDQIEPVIKYYATPSQQRKEIINAIEFLHKEQYCNNDIIILSPKAGSRCAASDITERPWFHLVAPIEIALTDQIRYTTIQSFKGLESSVVIVTDIEHVTGEMCSSLFYVATTRALERLYIFVHETAKPDIVQLLLGSSQGVDYV